MLGLKVQLSRAQEVKRYLLQHDLFDKRYAIGREEDSIIFPVTREFNTPFDYDVEFTQVALDERQLALSLRAAVLPLLTPDEAKRLRTAYDIVGSIAIIDIPPELEPKERLIGEKIMENNKTVKTVLKKLGAHQGVYRTQDMACVAGEDTRETTVMENGVKLRVHVEKTYYSIRMATERGRIVKLIKPGERVLCLFSGIGPYPITFSRHSTATGIVGIEINPVAHQLAVENVARNRCLNVRLLEGDAHEILPRLAAAGESFDRVTMPLPHSADDFLDEVLAVSHPGTVIHLYDFLEEGAFNSTIPRLRSLCAHHSYALARYDVTRVGQQSPRVWRICIDAEITRT